MEQMTFTKAVSEHFGKKPNQTAAEFMQEIRALTPEDREALKKEFAKIGVEITN
jgi:hypothetical protein